MLVLPKALALSIFLAFTSNSLDCFHQARLSAYGIAVWATAVPMVDSSRYWNVVVLDMGMLQRQLRSAPLWAGGALRAKFSSKQSNSLSPVAPCLNLAKFRASMKE